MYGVQQNWWHDSRCDIVPSIQAAISHLTHLNKMFDGNWLQALAAYNFGEGTVLRASRHNKREGKPTDFWSLDLPHETRIYVPKLIALANIIKDPEKYHYQTHFIPNEPYVESVNIGGQLDLDLAQATDMANISIDEVCLLNPRFNQWATAPNGSYRLLIPVKKIRLFGTKLAALPNDERVTWRHYSVKAGDNLSLVAKNHNSIVEVLEDVNTLSSTMIHVGQKLMISVAGNKIESYTFSYHQRFFETQSCAPSRNRIKIDYTVHPEDNL